MATLPVPPLSFGALLKRYRRLARLTQEQLAERAGFSPSFMSMLERGERMPVVATTELLAAALELSAAERDSLFAAHQRAIEAAVERDERGPRDQRHERDQGQPAQRDQWSAHSERWSPAGERAGQGEPALPVGGFLGATPDGHLVAREPEMRHLLAALATLVSGPAASAGQVVMLSGDAGIGKTRLAQEVALRARECGVLVAVGRCYERQQAVGLYPIREALGALLAGAPPEARARGAARWPDVLTLLPAAPAPGDASLAAGATGTRERLFRQLAECVAAVAAHQPLALLLDDLHWADEASLDVLRHLARQTRGMRVLLLGTYREREVRRLPALRAVLLDLVHDRLLERIALQPLTRGETAELLADTLGAGEVDAGLIAVVHAATQGNPFFARETIRALVERDEVALTDGCWRRVRGQADALALPETVRDTLVARMARLSPAAQAVLRAASVLGLVFTPEPLPALSGRSLAEVEAALEEALAAELIRDTEGPEYTFSHALTQRAIYGEIPAPRRRHAHLAAGEALEHLREGERARRAAELAQHFLRGDAPERALPYALLAGDQAVRVYAQQEAHQHYTLALDLASELGDQRAEAVAREGRADVRYTLGRMEDAYADLAAATHRYRMLGDWDRLTLATCQLARVCDPLNRVPESLRLVEELLDTLLAEIERRSPDGGAADHAPSPTPSALQARMDLASTILSARASARLVLCMCARFVHLGRFAEAMALSAPSIARARSADMPRFESLAYSFRATAQQALGQLDAAIRSLEGARRAAEASGDLEARFMACGTLAAIHASRAEPRAARTSLLQALDALTRLADTDRRGAMLDALARNAFVLGEWGAARAHWTESLALATSSDVPLRWLARLALLWLDIAEGKRPLVATLASDPMLRACQQGDSAVRVEALRRLTEAHILAGRAADQRELMRAVRPSLIHLPFDLSELDVLRAWVELELGDEAAAARELAQTRQAASARQERTVYADLWRIEALLALRQRRWDEAVAALDQALELCRAMPYPYAEAKALAVYGQADVARGNPDNARAHYQAALAICAWLGERLYAERIERALAELTPADAHR